MKVKLIVGVALFLAVIGFGNSNAFAMHFTTAPMAATLDCNGINVTNTSSVEFDRDNTGTGQEAYQVVGTDGAGNVIFGGSISQPVGLVIPQPPMLVPWISAPQYNLLTFRIVSLAGNGLPDQVIVNISGTCQGLPTFSTAVPTMNEWGMIIFSSIAGLGSVYFIRRRRRAA